MKLVEYFRKFNINIKDEELMQTAFTHSSYSNEHHTENYERLEFLGDAVLELITSEYFYLNTDLKEGDMTKKRASFVCENALATYAKKIHLEDFIRVGEGQKNNVNDTIIADVFESVLGAIYLLGGLEEAKKYLDQVLFPYIKEDAHFLGDYKSMLQEMVQTDKKSVFYEVVEETGPAHDKRFQVEVKVDGILYGTGIGKSKKEAEQNAAKNAIEKRANYYETKTN